ncbi:hypothetical protein [Bacillus badius]|uniref:hypothetical protein n=1 Tax=Bacillus badius TaxID=1455 RepID=UPI000698A0F7|nr:hypothetical protein [Bacillus badius]
MNIQKAALLVISSLILALFMLANTMTPSPGTSSGNGNPALFILFILIPLFTIMVALWISLLHTYPFRLPVYLMSMFLIVLHLSIAFVYQKIQLAQYREVIEKALIKRNGFADAAYIEDITAGLSFHVNNQYFNFNTYLMFLTFSLFSAMLFTLLDLWEKRKKNGQPDFFKKEGGGRR